MLPPGNTTGAGTSCSLGLYNDISKYCFVYKGKIPHYFGMGIQNLYGSFARDCCGGFNPPPTSWDCEITAYQSKAPYAPIYGCVEKFYPQVGQYATQQDCINSGCKDGPGPTIPTDPIIYD